MSLIMVCIGRDNENNYDGLIGLLDNLLNKLMKDKIKAQAILKNYELPLLTRGEEISEMCNISEGIISDALDEGMKKGIAQGIQQGLTQGLEQGREQGFEQGLTQAKKDKVKIVDNMVSNLGLDFKIALQITGITEEEYNEYKELV